MPVLPPKIGEKVTPLEDYMIDVNTVPANLTGLPALSVPVRLRTRASRWDAAHGPHFQEESALRGRGGHTRPEHREGARMQLVEGR